jgi:chemotaxis signal transduction protein
MLSPRERRRGASPMARPALLAFVVAGRARALSLRLVAGVAEIGAVTRLPSGDPANLGLIVHRGAVLPLIDLARLLHRRPAPERAPAAGTAGRPAGEAAASFCVITRSEPAVAFPVDEILGVQAPPEPPSAPGAAALPWEILDPLIVDLARDQDPAD